MIGELNYEETRYQIAPGDRLTFVSDGVVEATNQEGELLGFDRAAPLADKSAAAIADAAQQWGQEDDITVLTLIREIVGARANTQLPMPSLSL
jgi:sigma-B regulation protein RsbU (phosphoserine phosphatase)